MKERGFSFEPEQPAGQSAGSARGATVTRLRRPAKSEKPDVDNLVTDFLQALDTYSSEAEASDIAPPPAPVQEAPDPEPSSLEPSEKSAPPIEPIVAAEVKAPHAEVDAELDRTLREIELRPKLTIVHGPVHEVTKTLPLSPSVCEAPPEQETPDPVPVEAEEIGAAKPAKIHEALPDDEIWTVVRPKTKTGQGTMRLPLTYPLQTPWVKYRLVVGIPVLIGVAAVGLAIYFFSLLSSMPTGTGSGGISQSAAQTPGASSAQANVAEPQVAPDQLPPKASAPEMSPAKSTPAQSTREIVPPPAVKTPIPAARNEGNRTKNAAPANVQAQFRGLEANAAGPVKQATPPRREVQGNDNAVVTTVRPPPPPSPPALNRATEPTVSAPAGVKPTGPPAAAPADQKATEPPAAAAAKANVGSTPVDTPKVSPTAPPPAAVTPATSNPAEALVPKINTPEAKAEPAPLVIPAEPVFRASPAYPLTAQKMGITGTVEVRVSIDERGKVTKATAISGHNLLRFAAEDALLRWKFKPATLRGTSVKSELVVSVSFVR